MPKQVAKKTKAATKPALRSKAAGAGYHHGDLRQSLKVAALEVLAGPNAHLLSFRELARKLGVTTGAPYFHFKDRTDLLVQLAIDGFMRLHEQLERAAQRAKTNDDLVRSLTVAYLDFARKERGFYQAMFLPEVCAVEDDTELRAVADRCFRLVCSSIETIQKKMSPEQISDRAVSLWSLLHGITDLRAAGILVRRLSMEKENQFAVDSVHRLLQSWSETFTPA